MARSRTLLAYISRCFAHDNLVHLDVFASERRRFIGEAVHVLAGAVSGSFLTSCPTFFAAGIVAVSTPGLFAPATRTYHRTTSAFSYTVAPTIELISTSADRRPASHSGLFRFLSISEPTPTA